MKNSLNKRLNHWSTTTSTQDFPDANTHPPDEHKPKHNPARYEEPIICHNQPLPHQPQSTPSQTLKTLKSPSASEPMLTRSADSSRPLNGIARSRGTRILSTTGCSTSPSTGLRRSRNQPPSDRMTANALQITVAVFVLGLASMSLGFLFGYNARGVEEQGARIEYVDKTTAYASVQPKGGKFSF
jgi:hypothetical protein